MRYQYHYFILTMLILSIGAASFVAGQTNTGFDDITVYVGKDNCNDVGSGTQIEPLCSVQVGLNRLQAGDVLLLLDGVYHERVYLMESGTEAAPIIIRGQSHAAIIDAGCPDYPCDEALILASTQFINADDDDEPIYAGFFMGWNEHIILDGFTVRNAPIHALELVETHDVTLQNMRVENAALSLVNVYDSTNFRLLDSELSGGNLGRITPDGIMIHITHEESISIVNTDGFEIANNHLHDGFKEGINAKVGSRNGTIHHNIVERLCAVGIYLTEVHDIEVFNNTVSDIGFITNNLSSIGNRAETLQRCDEVLVGTLVFQPDWGADPSDPAYQQEGIGYEPGNGIMLAVGDLDDDLITGELYNITIYRNIVHDINVGCLVLWDELRETGMREAGQMHNIRILNNVFYDCARSRANWGLGIMLNASASDVDIHNNIIAFASDMREEMPATGVNISHNLFYQAGASVGVNSLSADPLFIDPNSNDFHLQANSPAIDSGVDVGLPFTGSAPDVGVFEFNS